MIAHCDKKSDKVTIGSCKKKKEALQNEII